MIDLKHKGDLEIDGNIQITGGTISINGNPIGGGDEWTGGTQYVLVKAEGTDIENAAELQAAYDLAVSLSASSTNRITIVASPGNYNFSASTFTMDTEYIDLVSLDGNRSVVFNAPFDVNNFISGSINITANNVFVKGIDVVFKNFSIGTNLNLLKIENCKGGTWSFGGGINFSNPESKIINGVFIDCQGGDGSFATSQGTASGVFINCVGGGASFANIGTASGTFTNCVGGVDSFGWSGTASGTFTNCTAGEDSFGGEGGVASGIFTNCVGGLGSFGGGVNGTLTGKLYRCQLTDGTFQTPTGSGGIVLGVDGDDDVINLP
jgi:hypothetical protein